MRVLHVVSHAQPTGGIENFLDVTFRALQRMNLPDIELEMCYTLESARITQEEAAARGFKLWGVRMSSNPLSFMRNFYRELRLRGPYDVVHAHLSHFCGLPLLCAKRAGVPVRIAHYHNLLSGHRNNWPRRLYERWLGRQVLASATDIYALTYAGLRIWFGARAATDPRMKVLRYGINVGDFENVNAREEVRRELGIPLGVPLIGHIGSFSWQKNHARLLTAFRMVVDARPTTHLVLVGSGRLEADIKAQIEELKLQDNVHLAGFRKDIPRVLSAMDLFVFPSLVEGFGKALLEAQAAGLPVVFTQIPTSAEAVAPIFKKFASPPEDTAALGRNMLAAMDATERDPSIVEQARAFAQRFTLDASIQSVLAAWRYPGSVAPIDPFEPQRAEIVGAAY